MRYFLNYENHKVFCEVMTEKASEEESEIEAIVEGCKNYYFEVYGNAYFISKEFERKIKHGLSNSGYVDSIFQLCDTSNYFIETLSYEFIDFMLKGPSNSAVSLDDEIVEIQDKFTNRYGY